MRLVLGALVAVLALLAAGCGGDDSDEASDAADTAVVETDSMDDAEDTDTTATATGDADEVLGGECAEFAGLGAKLQSAFGGGSGDLDSASEVFDELADRVPEEIREDYRVLADNFKQFADALKDVDLTSGETPSPETLAKLQQAASSMDQPEIQQASENIEAWVQENC